MIPQEFVRKWRPVALTERQTAQEHFGDLCRLLGEPTPIEADPDGIDYAFEKGVGRATGGMDWADVWKRGRFALEYKKRHSNLGAALKQLLNYAGALANPPMIFQRFEVAFREWGKSRQKYVSRHKIHRSERRWHGQRFFGLQGPNWVDVRLQPCSVRHKARAGFVWSLKKSNFGSAHCRPANSRPGKVPHFRGKEIRRSTYRSAIYAKYDAALRTFAGIYPSRFESWV